MVPKRQMGDGTRIRKSWAHEKASLSSKELERSRDAPEPLSVRSRNSHALAEAKSTGQPFDRVTNVFIQEIGGNAGSIHRGIQGHGVSPRLVSIRRRWSPFRYELTCYTADMRCCK